MRLEELRSYWAKVLSAPGPHWMIVMALQRLDQGEGASAQAIAEMLDTNPSFVVSHSRLLENKGLVRLTRTGEDSAAIVLALTNQARQHLAEISSRHQQD